MKMRNLIAQLLVLALLTLCPAMAEEFAPVVLTDTGNVAVQVISVDKDGIWGYTLDVLLTNRTDRELMFSVNGGRVNGYSSDPCWAVSVPENTEQPASISWMDLEEDGVAGEVTQIDLLFKVYDISDLNAEDELDAWLTVYPMGEENAQWDVRGAQDTDLVLFDAEYGLMTITGARVDEEGNYMLDIYMQNRIGNKISINLKTSTVNGSECDPYWAIAIPGQAQAVDTIVWSAQQLEDCGITEVQELQMHLSVYDFDDWSVPIFMDEVITVNP